MLGTAEAKRYFSHSLITYERGIDMSNTIFDVSFKLTRDNQHRNHDETFFDTQHIEEEIESWLSDLDFELPQGVTVKVERA
jgi:hypothetical protein